MIDFLYRLCWGVLIAALVVVGLVVAAGLTVQFGASTEGAR